MGNEILSRSFARMGARVKAFKPTRWQRERIRLDVRKDKAGEYFDLSYPADIQPEVIDVQPKLRHLVLMFREGGAKLKYLCGHDERHWFTAAVPGESVSGVASAIRALRPSEVPTAAGVIRQGEWFFVPAPGMKIVSSFINPIHRNEPLSRGAGSKPHMVEEMYRTGGVAVMISRDYPTGIDSVQYDALYAAAATGSREERERFNGQRWQRMVRDAEVYARGKVRHSDHATIELDGWHKVVMNTERFAPHAVNVAFLD